MSCLLLPPSDVDDVGKTLNVLMVGSIWTAALVPLLVILFFFSTPQTRRQPIFLMNTISVSMGIIAGIIDMILHDIQIKVIVAPSNLNSPTTFKLVFAYSCMMLFLPIYMSCILAFRLYVVYPRRGTPKKLLAVIFIPILIFKIARVTNALMYAIRFSEALFVDSGDVASPIPVWQNFWEHAPWFKIEWTMQVFDNCYASAFFLWKIWIGRRVAKFSGIVESTSLPAPSSAGKLKKLFYLALSSFVFPCILSVVQVAMAFTSPDFFLGTCIFISNLYLEIIGVLLATIWSGINASEGTQRQDGKEVSPPPFRRGGETDTSGATTLAGAHIDETQAFQLHDLERNHSHGLYGKK